MDELAKALEGLAGLDPQTCNRPLDAMEHRNLIERLNTVFRVCKDRMEADAERIGRLTRENETLREYCDTLKDRLAEAESKIARLESANALSEEPPETAKPEAQAECNHVFVTVTVGDDEQSERPTEAVCMRCGATKPIDDPPA